MVKNLRKYAPVFGLPLLILGFMVVLLQSPFFQSYPKELAAGMTLDLLITIPVVYFLMIFKKKEIPNVSALSVAVVCMIIAGFIIPENQQELLKKIRLFAIPIIELSVFSLLIYKTRKVVKAYRNTDKVNSDFYDGLISACTSVFPNRLGRILATEIAVTYYLLRPSKEQELSDHEFSYYKKSGIKTVICTFIGLILIETLSVHLFVERLSITTAWVLTALSLYTCLQMVSLLRSMNVRPISIDRKGKTLHLRYGFFNQTTIQVNEILSIEKNKRTLPEDKSILQFSPLGMLDTHNLIIKVKNLQTMNRIYGMEKKYKALAIYVDDLDRFIREIEKMDSRN